MTSRDTILQQRDQAMQNIDLLVDNLWAEYFGESRLEVRDELVTELCDMLCETIDP